MSYTTTLLDKFKSAKKIESDYAAAKLLGVTQQTLSNYRAGISHADDRIAITLADELAIDRLQTIARINADRAKKPEDRAFWRRIASAAGFALMFALPYFATSSTANANGRLDVQKHFSVVYYVKFWMRQVRDLARSLMRSAADLGAAAHGTA